MVGGKPGILAKDGPRKEEEGKVCEHCSGRLRGTDLLSGRILFGNGSGVCVCVYHLLVYYSKEHILGKTFITHYLIN